MLQMDMTIYALIDACLYSNRIAIWGFVGACVVILIRKSVQCGGKVNEEGISPLEDEDAPRTTYCDVRFDVKDPPKRVYCLYTGKVFCDSCANPSYKVSRHFNVLAKTNPLSNPSLRGKEPKQAKDST
jgi:hypothetical protein